MGLFDFIKSVFGLDETTRERTGETNVAVEREPNNEGGEVEEPVAEPTDVSGSTESILDEDDAASEPTEAAEPAEAAGPEHEDMTTDVERTGLESQSDAPAGAEPTVQEIKGIGPAYSERLDDVGIVTVSDLADADAEDLTERTAVSESRLREWIKRARDFEE